MTKACRVLLNRLDFRFGGGSGGGGGGGDALAVGTSPPGEVVAGLDFTPWVGGMDVGGAICTLSPVGVRGMRGAFSGGIGVSDDGLG